MKKFLSMILVSCMLLVTVGCAATGDSRIKQIEELTGYDLPSDGMKELYRYIGETFTGVASQYYVYSLSEMPSFMMKEKSEIDDNIVENMLNTLERREINVPKEYLPNPEKAGTYVTGDEDSVFIYSPDAKQLIVWIAGH